jgi:hypothetical protein
VPKAAASLADDLAALGIASVEEAGSSGSANSGGGSAADGSVLVSRPRGAWLRAALALAPHSAPAWQSLADWSATAHFPCSHLRPQDEPVLSPCP